MVSKKILGVAIAAALSSSAFADIDLTSSTPAVVKYAKETLLTTDKTTVSSVDYYTVTAGANADLDLTTTLGVGMNTAQKLFIRVDLTNALFATAPSWTLANTTATVAQGGAGAAYTIFEVTASASIAQTATPVVTVPDLKLNSNFSGTAATITVYETLTGAVNQTSSLYSKSVANAVTVVSGLKQTATPGTAVADVESGFKKFVGSVLTANIGKFETVVDTATVNRLGVTTAIADIATAGAFKITGDFSIKDNATYNMNTQADCAGAAAALTEDAGKTFVSTTFAAMTANPYFCEVSDGTKVLVEGVYNATQTYTAVTNAAFAPAVFSGKIGEVTHNGTTIQVPYLTTLTDYNQRVVLVNRGGADVTYTFTFTPEVGNTATAGSAATGTLKAGSTTVLKAADVVSLSGNTRTAATIAVVSAAANIDAATTTVNLADKSTDTVKLK